MCPLTVLDFLNFVRPPITWDAKSSLKLMCSHNLLFFFPDVFEWFDHLLIGRSKLFSFSICILMFAHLQVIFHATDRDKPIRLWSPFQIKMGRFAVYLITSHLYSPRCWKTITLKLLVYEWKAYIKHSHFLHWKCSLATEAYSLLSQKL